MWIKNIFDFIKPLLCDNGSGMSMGRIGLWLTLYPAIILWLNEKDIQENHLYVLGFLLLYNFSKKLKSMESFVLAIRGIKSDT